MSSNNTEEAVLPEKITDMYILGHGCLMILSYVVFIKIAIFSAMACKKHVFDNDKKWFLLHKSLNLVSAVLVIIGIILSFKAANWLFLGTVKTSTSIPSSTVSVKLHANFGIAVFSLTLFQVILGFLRPKLQSNFRVIFNGVHTLIGSITMGLSSYCLYSGLILSRYGSWSWLTTIFFAYVAIETCMFLGLKWLFVGERFRSKVIFYCYFGICAITGIILIAGLTSGTGFVNISCKYRECLW